MNDDLDPLREIFLNATIGHAALGMFFTVMAAPLFTWFGFPWFLSILGWVLACAITIEILQWKAMYEHKPTTFRQSLGDVAEYLLGAVVATAMIGLSVDVGKF